MIITVIFLIKLEYQNLGALFNLFFILSLCSHTAFAGPDPIEKTAESLAQAVAEYERIVQMPAEDGVYRKSPHALVLNPERARELLVVMADLVQLAQKQINDGNLNVSSQPIIAEIQAPNFKKGLLENLISGALIGAGIYFHVEGFTKAVVLLSAGYFFFKGQIKLKRAELGDAGFDLNKIVQIRRERFYKTFRKELQKQGSQIELPAWNKLESAHQKSCELLFTERVQLRLLMPPVVKES